MPASFYHPIYLILVSLLTIIIVNKYPSSYIRFKFRDTSYQWQSLILALFLILFIGLRPLSGKYFVDMYNYYIYYYTFYYKAPDFTFNWNAGNYIFHNLFSWMGFVGFDIDYFFLLFSFIYFGSILWACHRLFPRDTLLAFLMYLGAFSTFSYGTNGIKAGVAASLFLLGISFKEKKLFAFFFIFLSLGMHHSMIVPIVAYIISNYYRNPNLYLYGWFFCLLLATAHVTFFMSLFSGFTDDTNISYLSAKETNRVSGFRPDFYLYSFIPIYIGYYSINKIKFKSVFYIFIWQIYTLTNCVFLLCTYGNYINRIAYLSWLLYPIILLYPFIYISMGKQQNTYIKYVVFGHLSFSIFMFFI